MTTRSKIRTGLGFTLCLLLFIGWVIQEKAPAPSGERISKFGAYKGYSEPVYKEWIRFSEYVPVRDGTRLAVDIIRPAKDGKPVEEALPVIWTHHRYHRAHVMEDGTLRTALDSRWLETVLKHGYVIAAVDVRGGGASFGNRQGPFTPAENRDAYDITEWLASRPWCSGKIGMYGRSYLGITQYMAASTSPPHLVAVFPEMALFDAYDFVYPGGVFHHDFIGAWSHLVQQMDNDPSVAPVDEDKEKILLERAIEEHQANTYALELVASKPYRDSRDEDSSLIYSLLNPSNSIQEIKKSGVAVYHLVGWYDLYPRDAILWFKNLDNPQRLVIGPWHHSAGEDDFLAAEHLRWYDFWLKDIDNGIMEEAPITYFTMGAAEGTAWRQAWEWPLPQEKPTPYYFHGGKSQSVNSANDGILRPELPGQSSGQDDYAADYSATSGKETRWTNGYGGGFNYPDMTTNDEKGLTYTTHPLDADMEVTGHPVIHLWVTSTAEDADLFAYLEEVDETGYSHYITEGTLRASHRSLSPPPYENVGLPFHRSYAGDISPLPEEPAELVFDLLPTSNIFDAGHRIRVTLTCADKDTALTPELLPLPTVSLYRNADFPSHIVLPLILQAEPMGEMPSLMVMTIVLVGVLVLLVLMFFWLRGRLRKA